VKIIRIFAGEDGRSQFEHLSIESSPELLTMRPATATSFLTIPAGEFRDFHPAPRRQIAITLEGEMEIGLEDGTTEVFGAGDVLIAEDVDNRGHTLRITSSTPRVSVSVALPN
jgi:quercetin dioxygenase-like cupin family protein